MSIKWKPKADGYFFKKFLGNLEYKKKILVNPNLKDFFNLLDILLLNKFDVTFKKKSHIFLQMFCKKTKKKNRRKKQIINYKKLVK